jgi:MOSC domain-containing protein YiiM
MAGPVRPGKLEWIGLRPARSAPMLIASEATFLAHQGIAGDRYRTQRDGPRQVTLIASEDIEAIAAFLGRPSISPTLLRRNLVTRGINLHAMKAQIFRIGAVVLEATGECAPCSRMETSLGPGGYNAMRGRGGLTARIIEGGVVRIGDAIERVRGR